MTELKFEQKGSKYYSQVFSSNSVGDITNVTGKFTVQINFNSPGTYKIYIERTLDDDLKDWSLFKTIEINSASWEDSIIGINKSGEHIRFITDVEPKSSNYTVE